MAPRAKKEQTEEIDAVKDNSATRLSQILKDGKDDHYNFSDRVNWKISTGSLLIDMATGGIGPCMVRMCGMTNEGKTAESLEIVRNFLKDVSNSKAFWVLAEGRGLSEENINRCGLTFVYNAEDWKVGTVFVLESNVYELFIQCVKDLVINNEDKIRYCFVVDSIDGLQLKDDKAKEITENNKVAGVPALSKKMLQALSLNMFKHGHLMILISQVTSEIKIDPYTKTANRVGSFSGGNALLHASDWIFEYSPCFNGDYILDNKNGKLNDGKSKTIGKWAKVTIQKSARETAKKQLISYPIKFGKKPSGIWLEYEISDMLLAWDLVKKAGAWLSFTDTLVEQAKLSGVEIEVQHQGVDNLRIYLEQNPNVTEFLYKRFKEVLSN